MASNFRLQQLLTAVPAILLLLACGSHVPATQNPATALDISSASRTAGPGSGFDVEQAKYQRLAQIWAGHYVDPKSAFEQALEFVALFPDIPQGLQVLVRLAGNLDRLETLEQSLEAPERLQLSETMASCVYAMLEAERGNWQEAIQKGQAAIAAGARDLLCYDPVVVGFLASRRYEAGTKYFSGLMTAATPGSPPFSLAVVSRARLQMGVCPDVGGCEQDLEKALGETLPGFGKELVLMLDVDLKSEQRRFKEARDACRAACTEYAAQPWRLDQLSCDIHRAALELQLEEYWKGEALLKETLKQATSLGEQASLASIQVLLGDVCLATQRTQEAAAHYARAIDLYHRLGDVRREEVVRNRIQAAFDSPVFTGGTVTPLSHPPDANPDTSPGR